MTTTASRAAVRWGLLGLGGIGGWGWGGGGVTDGSEFSGRGGGVVECEMCVYTIGQNGFHANFRCTRLEIKRFAYKVLAKCC